MNLLKKAISILVVFLLVASILANPTAKGSNGSDDADKTKEQKVFKQGPQEVIYEQERNDLFEGMNGVWPVPGTGQTPPIKN